MLDLNTINPETVLASPELDALIAEKWMGWTRSSHGDYWLTGEDVRTAYTFEPSTNPAHAGEARRKAKWFSVEASPLDGEPLGITCWINRQSSGGCWYDETNGDKGKAEALATCRAIVEALKAAKAAGGE